ncbi:hypothetical protein B1806_08900 [Metallibacterium scheffleri]|uniref:Uncharacterized protein n=1 Tax=Metallibacterium scheffleri TaxID=993689 RepID=A0A4S3KNB2_9GAMM|nr:hypothetical protein B1806_08900 [Metallibacterium scheffleri]
MIWRRAVPPGADRQHPPPRHCARFSHGRTDSEPLSLAQRPTLSDSRSEDARLRERSLKSRVSQTYMTHRGNLAVLQIMRMGAMRKSAASS